MKLKLFLLLIGAAIVAVGCVHTVDDRSATGIPGTRDKMMGKYQFSVDKVYAASKTVLMNNGTLERESIISATNSIKVLEGKVNKVKVWMRVEQIEPSVTQLTVQGRTSWGASDLNVMHQLEKEVALELAK